MVFPTPRALTPCHSKTGQLSSTVTPSLNFINGCALASVNIVATWGLLGKLIRLRAKRKFCWCLDGNDGHQMRIGGKGKQSGRDGPVENLIYSSRTTLLSNTSNLHLDLGLEYTSSITTLTGVDLSN